MKDLFKVITTPSCWIRNYETSKMWDSIILKLLENPKDIHIVGSKVVIDGVDIWRSNYPYAYGSPYDSSTGPLPSRATVFKLKAAIDEYLMIRILKGMK